MHDLIDACRPYQWEARWYAARRIARDATDMLHQTHLYIWEKAPWPCRPLGPIVACTGVYVLAVHLLT